LSPISFNNTTNTTNNSNNNPKFKIQTRLVCLLGNGVFYLIDCTLGSNNYQKQLNNNIVFVPTLASKDDCAIDFVACKQLLNLIIVISETKKIFLMDIELGQFIIELDNTTDFKIDLEKIQLSLASKDSLLFVRTSKISFVNENEIKEIKLMFYSLKLIPRMDDYYSRSHIQLHDNYLPNGSFLKDRIKNLMKTR